VYSTLGNRSIAVNEDLGLQIQHLLKESMEDAGERSSEELAALTFGNIQELQQKNNSLLNEIRTLQYQHERDLQLAAENNYTVSSSLLPLSGNLSHSS